MAASMLCGLAGFAFYMVLVMIGLRSVPASPAAIVVYAAIAAYVVLLAAAGVALSVVMFWPATIVYSFLVLSFLMVFGAVYKSISLRILADLLQRPCHADRHDNILGRYIREDSFHNRLEIIVAQGFATCAGNRFELTEKGRRLARFARALQRAFRIEKSG